MIDRHILDLEKGHNKFKMRQGFCSFAFKRALKIYCSVTTYTQKKKKKKKNTIKNFGFSSLTQNCTWPELEQMEYTLAYRGIPWPTGLSRSRSEY